MVGTGVKPRNIILALDKEYLSTAVLRPDKIQVTSRHTKI